MAIKTELTEQQVCNAFPAAYRRIPETYKNSSPKFYLDEFGTLIGDWSDLEPSFVWDWAGSKVGWTDHK
jgi:EAL domain-containing protein (putative c-di-GMP-specific phosphodiesterase class I)